MFKKTVFILGLILVLGTLGCASPEAGVESAAVSGSGLSADYADAMPVVSQLAAGTVALENGANAVTDDQAAGLLPLWQAYASLVADGSTAEAELNALVTQIEQGMTDAQISEIAQLQLTNAKLQEMIEAGEIQLGRGGRGPNGQGGGPPADGGGQGGGGRGQGGLGGRGGGGQGGGGLGAPDPETVATRQAERIEATGGGGAFLTAQVSGAVVRLLTVKVNGEQAPQGGENPFNLANEAVASTLGIAVEELLTAAEDQTIQEVVVANGGDLDTIIAAVEEVLADSRAAQNGGLQEFIDTYFASNGVGRGRGNGNNNGGRNGDRNADG